MTPPLPRMGVTRVLGEGAPEPSSTATPAAIFRLGYASSAARSPRLPLAELWTTGQAAQDSR